MAPTAAPVAVPTARGPAPVTFPEIQPEGSRQCGAHRDALPQRRDLPLPLARSRHRLRRTETDRADQGCGGRCPGAAVRDQRGSGHPADSRRETNG